MHSKINRLKLGKPQMLQLDSHKLLFHLTELNKWCRGEAIYPIYVAISPSGNCMYRCIFCAYEYLQNKNLFASFILIHAIIKIFSQLTNYLL